MAAFVGSGVVTVRKRGAVERRVRRRTTVSVLAEGEDVKKLVAPSVDLKNGFQVPEQRTDPQLGFRFGSRKLRVFGGSNIGVLHREVASYLGKEDSEDPIVLKQFADGENYVRIQESVRGCDVFLVQSTCNPVNDNLMELLLMIDASRRAHAGQITAVIPYYGYARADRLVDGSEALSSKLVANIITKAGADRVIVMDMHSAQSCGFFDIPVDHVYGSDVLVNYIRKKELDDIVIVSPDVGGVARARQIAKECNDAPLAIIDKRRSGHNVAEVMHVIGDVSGKTAVLVDDMIDTAGTICAGAQVLRDHGAKAVMAMATHAVFSGPAVERLSRPGLFEEVVVTNTIPLPEEKQFPQLRVISVAETFGEAIWKVHEDYSVTFRA
uniref:ribose-phosphate diphosphokinase n=2 Tax=Rhodosorus marinus TaxID=101924 RepID=A0A7S3EFB8_9RHOD|mmetsp:Transcript_27919/g.109508  ORF Transcript_27919/g.109508 Transcript_27919/m.109508 type:complete len:382 (+) Transcript_27919:99-1244(+)|eukprot:CAMPEP_0113954328 /NCGR_PEP_ID=MMETSP0011_2-20120614/457_1 /TAXON_ID=101924 /ORGANISM="Rhodosorus marinus" /LENGTH=381 /DNA_ID=CAMNT_0000963375 /DNA_START=96 /DNA_END=1241 /DNA_ORIENTATION=+ /assembly_acc=CAM_ASM_000156